MNNNRITIFTAALLLALIAGPGALLAADFSAMSNEELLQTDPRQLSSEEREQFRAEVRQRMQQMAPEEQEAFRNEMRSKRNAKGGYSGGRRGTQ